MFPLPTCRTQKLGQCPNAQNYHAASPSGQFDRSYGCSYWAGVLNKCVLYLYMMHYINFAQPWCFGVKSVGSTDDMLFHNLVWKQKQLAQSWRLKAAKIWVYLSFMLSGYITTLYISINAPVFTLIQVWGTIICIQEIRCGQRKMCCYSYQHYIKYFDPDLGGFVFSTLTGMQDCNSFPEVTKCLMCS